MILIYNDMFGLYEVEEIPKATKIGTIVRIEDFFLDENVWVTYQGPYHGSNTTIGEYLFDDLEIEDMPPKLRALLLISNLT